MIEIKELVERARGGDRAAYGELCLRFHPTVYALAMARLRNPSEAEELVQEVFLHCMRKLPQLRDAHCFAGWLRQITVRKALNKLTRRGPFQGVAPEVLDGAEAGGSTPLDDMVRSEQRAELRAALTRLKPLDRRALVAFYIRGQSLKEMSDAFATPVGTIKRRLHVARKRLRRYLDRGTLGGDRFKGRRLTCVCE
jgi:RNA polymerase sigma-70 factor (ECF subfamily)